MVNFRRTERCTVRTICGVKLMDKKLVRDIMWMLVFSDTIGQFAVAI